MNKVLTLLFGLILLLSPIAGCLEENTEENDTTPEDEPSPINQDVNETDDNSEGFDDGDGAQLSSTLNIVDQLKKKTTITAENVQKIEQSEEQTDVAKNLRAMLKTKTRSPFDEN